MKILDRLGVREPLLAVAEPVENGLLAFDDIRIEVPRFDRDLGAPMLNVRRVTLDAILLEAAAAAGAEVRTGTDVRGLIEAGGRVVGVETTAGRSCTRPWSSAPTAPARRSLAWWARPSTPDTRHRASSSGPTSRACRRARQVWLGRIGEQAFLASPTDSDLFLAAVVPPVEPLAMSCAATETGTTPRASPRWPELAAQIGAARRVGPVRMMSRWHGFFRESAGPGWALVGDAGHFKDPTPGQGIADALRQAVALSEAIERALGGAEDPDRVLRDWWSWRDRDAWEMYWFAQDMAARRTPHLSRAIEERMAVRPAPGRGPDARPQPRSPPFRAASPRGLVRAGAREGARPGRPGGACESCATRREQLAGQQTPPPVRHAGGLPNR